MVKYTLIRLEDGEEIGTMSDKYPYPIEWTRQATLADREFFEKLLTRPLRRVGGGRDGDNRITVLHEFEPKDDQFFDAAVSGLLIDGYDIQE